jgi:hypothetical protein
MAYKRDREAFLFSTLGESNEGHPLNQNPGFDATDAVLDPYLRLFVGVTVQAMRDLKASDPVISLDSFLWLMRIGFPYLRSFKMLNLSDDLIFDRIFGGHEWVASLRRFQNLQAK